MRKPRQFLSVALFGGLACVLLAILAFTTISNAMRDKDLIIHNALTQGYWIARSLEIGHSMMMHNHRNALRDIITAIEQQPDVHFLTVLDANRQVLVASDSSQQGTPWPDDFGQPPETGGIIKSTPQRMELVFPAFFARAFETMQHHHPQANDPLRDATWIIMRLDTSKAHAHYRNMVVQSVILALSVVILGLGAFVFFGMIQRYQLAHASLAHLEQITRHLARFVPGTVQKLIEENPEHPSLNKAEHDATILFLDIDHYTKISQDISPQAVNHLIERYFSAFLDIILSHSGDINETAGDGIMAIFTGTTRHAHAVNAVNAAVRIREQARALNRERAHQEPDIQVNIGINTGPVLLGATIIKGAVRERLTYTASGMVTNIAARLCDLGNAGEIHLSEVTASEVMGQCKLHGPLQAQLKHIQHRVPVYRVE